MRKRTKSLLLAASLGLLTAKSAYAEPKITPDTYGENLANKDIICKVPEFREYQLKIHSCATIEYGLVFPIDELAQPEPTPEPTPPYST